jgi:hypothetical protein
LTLWRPARNLRSPSTFDAAMGLALFVRALAKRGARGESGRPTSEVKGCGKDCER